jgi:hypothetical protein
MSIASPRATAAQGAIRDEWSGLTGRNNRLIVRNVHSGMCRILKARPVTSWKICTAVIWLTGSGPPRGIV